MFYNKQPNASGNPSLHAEDLGYSRKLDKEGDGIACEK
ncbi:excalibur calcium-binding domain-containing protein [Bacillus sp. WLY-B-L8]